MRKQIILSLFLFSSMTLLQAQTTSTMKQSFIDTNLGKIAIYQNDIDNEKTPIIFLHGVYFDHQMWEAQAKNITDRKVITIDMPLHGESKTNISENWTLEDCGKMLLEIIAYLKIEKVITIGQSWGSMTILRAAGSQPEKFAAIGFCNMPFEAATKKTRRQFSFQHSILMFRKFYHKQVAKALYGKAILAENPQLLDYLNASMGKLTNKEVKLIDKTVITQADDATVKVENLKVPALALKGKEDYVPNPPKLELTLVEGGHVSPVEVPEEVLNFVQKVIALERKNLDSKP